jgi:hypothetical protein
VKERGAGVRDVDFQQDHVDACVALDDELPRQQHVALLALVERFRDGERRAARQEAHARHGDAERDVDLFVLLAEHDRPGTAQRPDELIAFTNETQGLRESDEADDRRCVVHA